MYYSNVAGNILIICNSTITESTKRRLHKNNPNDTILMLCTQLHSYVGGKDGKQTISSVQLVVLTLFHCLLCSEYNV